MAGIRFLTILLLLGALAGAGEKKGDEPKSVAAAAAVKEISQAINKVYKGRVIKIKKNRVTIYYDFEEQEQLQDFQDARPPRLLDGSQNKVRISGGRLVLEGSTAIRHKMEGKGMLKAHFYAIINRRRNCGTYFTEPILSDFFIVLNFFDERFYKNGAMFLCACGLHEDEGADTDMTLVNWRDIFASNLRKKVKTGKEFEVEVYKNGWEEFCRVEDVKGKGSSKKKCKKFESYQVGFWVHGSRMSMDDLTITVDLTDEFLQLNDLKAEVEWEEVPTRGPLAGVSGVPPRVVNQVEMYAAGKGEVRDLFKVMKASRFNRQARFIVSDVIAARKDKKVVPIVIEGLYSEDDYTRKITLGIIKKIVGKTFGYSARGSKKARSKAIRKLNVFLAQHRDEYYG